VWLLIPLLLVAAAWAVWRFFPDLIPIRSDNMQLGKGVKVAQTTVPASGGTVDVEAPGSALDGLRITVPEGAYDKSQRFTVAEVPIENWDLGPNFHPVGPAIRVDNGHRFAEAPMTVEIPVSTDADKFAMAFFYDSRTGELEGIPPVAVEADKLTVATSHFSDIVITEIDRTTLDSLELDTGFAPGVDDWQFPNHGSIVAPGGHCAGQSITAMWYFYEQKRLKGEPSLYALFDNNNYPYRTTSLWFDDSWGYRFASTAQHHLLWGTRSTDMFSRFGDLGDQWTYYAFGYSMLLTGEPQFAYISGTYTDAQGAVQSGAHAIIAYKIGAHRIYVADPNYPGQSDRYIRFEGQKLLPYSSGASADAIAAQGEVSFTYMRYMAKTALIDWEKLRDDYAAMLKGEAGDGVFPAYTLERLVSVDPVSGEEVWVECEDIIELDEAATALAGENLRGKVRLRVKMDNAAAPQGFEVLVFVRDKYGATLTSTNGTAGATLKLKVGATRAGHLSEIKKDNSLEYNDFHRIKILYERPSWPGNGRARCASTRCSTPASTSRRSSSALCWFAGITDDEAAARGRGQQCHHRGPEPARRPAVRLHSGAIAGQERAGGSLTA
jgi:hypothetical protein